MSIIVSNSQEISNSPLNLSKSKQLYSFPKDKRFHNTGNKLCETFYDLPSTRVQRSTSFGFGKKLDLANISCSPAPNKYSLHGDFEHEKDKSRGFSLGLGRNDVHFGGVFGAKDEKIPGPGSYKATSQMSNISYSIRIRTPNQQDKYISTCKSIPGPGTYTNPLSLSTKGRYPSSSYKNPGCYIIHPQTAIGDSDKKRGRIQPGPGTYNPPSAITTTGKQNVYKYRSSGACTFAHSGRDSIVQKGSSLCPGPGFYRLPSEFGYYESKSVHLDRKSQSPGKP